MIIVGLLMASENYSR